MAGPSPCTSSRCATRAAPSAGTVGIALDVTDVASRRPGPARVGGAAPPGHRPRAALHLREGRGRPLPPGEPGRGRGLRHHGRRSHGPHGRRLRPVGGGGAALPRGRPRGDPQRPTPGRPRGADHRRAGPRAAPADHEDPLHLLRHRPSRRARRVDRHLGEEGGGGGPAARGEGGEPQRARRRRGPRLQQPARRDPRPRLAGPEAAPGREPGAAARREGGERGGAGRRPHPADAGLLGARALRGAAHRRERPRAREPAAARGGAAEERAARGAALRGPAAGRRRRRPDPAGADEPGHQRRGGHRRAGRDRHGGHGDESGRRVRRVAVAGERAATRAGPLRAPRGARRRAGDGRGDRGPDLRAVLHDEVHRARPRARRGPRVSCAVTGAP